MPFVAAFRSSEHLVIHIIAGLTGCAIAIIFLITQTKMSYILITNVNSLRIARIRLICTILAFIFGTFATLAVILSAFGLKVQNHSKVLSVERLLWDESYGGYVAHCLSAMFEWLAMLTLSPFFATFVPEFKNIKSHNGKIECKYEIKNSIDSNGL
jgi:hypothetical protein